MIYYIILAIVFLLIVLYMVAIMPRMLNSAERKQFIGICFAHRGIHNNNSTTPENSLPAFALAVEQGYGIELDVQLTKDNILVVFHDNSLKRVCGVDKKVNELTFDEIQQYNLFQSEHKIPLFEDVLKVIDGKVPLIVELKVEWNVTDTCEIVNQMLSKYQGVYCIESFSPLALIWYKKNNPKIMRGQLSTNFIKDKEKGNKKIIYFIMQNLMTNFLTKPDFIAYNYKYRNKLSLVICHRFYGALTFAWTIQSQEAFEESKKNYEAFIFDSFLIKT